MNLRRILAVLMAALLLIFLPACGKEEPVTVVQPSEAEETMAAEETAATVEIAETTVATALPVVVHPVPEETQDTAIRRSEAPGDASGFVLLTDVVPDAILEIRYYSTYNFVGERIDGYEEPCALLSREAALALKDVSGELMAMGYRLKIFDAYRPQMAVDHFIRWAEDREDTRMKACFYPDVPKAELFDRGYIASRSGHSRGSTVDLTLVDMATGREVDMGGPFDFFGALSHWDYEGLTEQQRENRRILRDAMTAHGFRAINTEWWHFALREEPYPDLYFTFPVCEDSVLPAE